MRGNDKHQLLKLNEKWGGELNEAASPDTLSFHG
jgi:hypothetical protein